MSVVNDYQLRLGNDSFVPIMIGGMGVDISTIELALVAAKLGGIGHISDAMIFHVSDRHLGTNYVERKQKQNTPSNDPSEKKPIVFDLDDVYQAQRLYVQSAMQRKQGPGAIFVNVMEKLTMANPLGTLKARLQGALDGGIDGITLSAGLHKRSLQLISDHPRFRSTKLGIIVSSDRALKVFLRSGSRCDRLPDYIVVEGPLAGGHLGFGQDWDQYQLSNIVSSIHQFLRDEQLSIPVIPAGGIFDCAEAVPYLENGAGAVQVATRFTVTSECGLPSRAKQAYLAAQEEDVIVSCASPTGYLIRMLKQSPALRSWVHPECIRCGYVLDQNGECSYITAFNDNGGVVERKKEGHHDKICLCHHFSRHNCYTCGHNVYRLKETTTRQEDGTYKIVPAQEVFYQYQHGDNWRKVVKPS